MNYLYHLYNFDLFPRSMGNPIQDKVGSEEEFGYYIAKNNGRHPVFTSSNFVFGESVLYTQMPWDVDTDKGNSLEEAYREVKKLVEYFPYDHLLTFSGNGFHFYLKFTPTILPLTPTLRYNIYYFQKRVVDELGLKTVNLSCAEPKRMIRVPLTKYVYIESGKHIATDRWAIPLNDDSLQLKLEDIISQSRLGMPSFQILNHKTHPVEPLMVERDVVDVPFTVDVMRIYIPFLHMDEKLFDRWLKKVFDPLLLTKLMSIHPDHISNLLALTKLREARIKGLGLNEKSVREFYARMSKNWDNRDLNIQAKYIHYSFTRD